jgi:thioesterase domain-containing protein
VARVRSELGAELPVSQLLQAPTVRAMAAAIEAREKKVRPPLVALQTFGERRPFFLAHPAGGHVVCYRALAVLMAPEQPVYALQPRGLEGGQTPIDDLPAMAAYYLEAIRRMQPVGPYRLGGWSFGGVLAWEMARQLREAGDAVEMLAMLDTAPIGEDGIRVDPRETAEVVWSTVAGLAGYAAASRVDVETLRGLEPRDAALAMIRGIQAPRILDESRLDDVLALTAVRGANLRAQLAYVPRPLDVHVTYFRTAGSALTEDAGHAVEFWTELAGGGITVHPVTGSHGLILNEPHVHAVVNAILALDE